MEQNTAQRAADTITELLQAVVSDSASEIDVQECMQVRDELRDMGHDLGVASRWDLPEVGDTMWSDHCPVTIVEVTDYPANMYHLDNGDGETVAAYNGYGSYDPQSPVVKATYPDGEKAYAFPLDRLSHEKP